MQFHVAMTARKVLEKIIARRNKVSLFDHFKVLPSFLRTMPQSLHFYPKAKKITSNSNIYQSAMKMTREAVMEGNQPYYLEFFEAIDNPKLNIKKRYNIISRFLVENF